LSRDEQGAWSWRKRIAFSRVTRPAEACDNAVTVLPPVLRQSVGIVIASRREIRRVFWRLEGKLEVRTWQPLVGGLTSVAVAASVAFLPSFVGLSDAGRWALFIAVLAALLWITEAIPTFAVALLVIGLEIAILGRPGGPYATGADDWKIFIEPWGSPLIWLFFGGFVLARGIRNSHLDRWLALRVLRRFGTEPRQALMGSMLVTFLFSMFASNTATAAMMCAVLAPVIASRKGDPFAKALLLGVAFAANIGGMATIIGTPPNAIAAGLLADVAPIGFARWLLLGLPPAIVLLGLAGGLLLRKYPSTMGPVNYDAMAAPVGETELPMWRRLVVVLGGAVTVGLWLTEPLHGISPPVVAFVPVTVFAVSGVINSEDIRSLEWDVLLLLAGGLALGVAVSRTGLASYLVSALSLQGTSAVVLALVLAAVTAALSNFMSNTAAANITVPIGLALAIGYEAQVVVPIALAASAAMCLPISTPSNAIASSSGDLESKDFIQIGLILGVVAIALAVGWTSLLLS
tara:strand:- start:13460 stop:15013 length:1554 start_codon:yes stop_codon:yes gene_type:complete